MALAFACEMMEMMRPHLCVAWMNCLCVLCDIVIAIIQFCGNYYEPLLTYYILPLNFQDEKRMEAGKKKKKKREHSALNFGVRFSYWQGRTPDKCRNNLNPAFGHV